MSHDRIAIRLASISTSWSLVEKANSGLDEERHAAQQLIVERYGPAVRRYLETILGDSDAADVSQEFALSLIRGDLRHADQSKGRFRNYVKSVVTHLVIKHRQREQRFQRSLKEDRDSRDAPLTPTDAEDKDFNEAWRAELLSRTWRALADVQPNYHTVLRWRVDHPKVRSSEMADQLRDALGKSLTAAAVRQMLRRARGLFGELLLEEITCSLDAATPEVVEEELAELDLLKYCQPALSRWVDSTSG